MIFNELCFQLRICIRLCVTGIAMLNDLMLKPSCSGCGVMVELNRSNCMHLTLCILWQNHGCEQGQMPRMWCQHHSINSGLVSLNIYACIYRAMHIHTYRHSYIIFMVCLELMFVCHSRCFWCVFLVCNHMQALVLWED